MGDLLSRTPLTHPATAWVAQATPLWLTLAAVLGATLLLHGRLHAALHRWLQRRAARQRRQAVAAALCWAPPILDAGQLLGRGLAALLLVLAALLLLAPSFLALLLAGPALLLLLWLLLWAAEQRYVAQLDAALVAAVDQLGTHLRTSGFPQALGAVVAELPTGPLRAEWQFLRDHLGAPRDDGAPATAAQVVAALAAQTPSRRHATLLGHLEVALDQPHNLLVQRVQAAAAALHTIAQRQSRARTELAQMRYSGVALCLTGTVMTLDLLLTQSARVLRAYQGPLGLAASALVAAALLAPLLGGLWLARVADIEY